MRAWLSAHIHTQEDQLCVMHTSRKYTETHSPNIILDRYQTQWASGFCSVNINRNILRSDRRLPLYSNVWYEVIDLHKAFNIPTQIILYLAVSSIHYVGMQASGDSKSRVSIFIGGDGKVLRELWFYCQRLQLTSTCAHSHTHTLKGEEQPSLD